MEKKRVRLQVSVGDRELTYNANGASTGKGGTCARDELGELQLDQREMVPRALLSGV